MLIERAISLSGRERNVRLQEKRESQDESAALSLTVLPRRCSVGCSKF